MQAHGIEVSPPAFRYDAQGTISLFMPAKMYDSPRQVNR
jgi:hypothetical protein